MPQGQCLRFELDQADAPIRPLTLPLVRACSGSSRPLKIPAQAGLRLIAVLKAVPQAVRQGHRPRQETAKVACE